MNNKLIEFNLSQRTNKDLLKLRSGDVVRVHRKIKEGEKERIQIFEGMIIAIKGRQSSSPMITVHKISNGVGVEIVVAIFSPGIDKIEIVKRAKVRRAKLYYVRDKTVKALRLKYQDMVDFFKKDVNERDNEEEKSEDITEEGSVKKEEKGNIKKEETKKDEEDDKETRKEVSVEKKEK